MAIISIQVDTTDPASIREARAWLDVVQSALTPPAEGRSGQVSDDARAATPTPSKEPVSVAPDALRARAADLARQLVSRPDGATSLKSILTGLGAPRLSAVPDDSLQDLISQTEEALS